MSTVGAVTASAATFPRTPRSVITVTETDISLPSAETARETESYTNTENVPSATATARSDTTIDDHIKNALQNEERFLFLCFNARFCRQNTERADFRCW